MATEEINDSHLKGRCQWKWGHGCIQGLSQRRETNLFTSEIQRDVRESGKWVGVLEARGSSTHCPGVACLPQKSWRERAPPAIWGPPPELCCVLMDGESILWEWWPKRGSRGESEDADEKRDSWSEGLGERSPDGKVGSLLRRRAPVAGHLAGRAGRGNEAHAERRGQWALGPAELESCPLVYTLSLSGHVVTL